MAYVSPGGGEGELNHCDMYMYLPQKKDNDVFRKQALHEIGHCLGLGHSLNRKDIMAVVGVGTKEYIGDGHLTDRDKETIQMIYS